MNKAIEIKNLNFTYDISSNYILKGLDLTVDKGEIIILAGLSGSGKSTLLNIISGIIPHIHKGRVEGSVKLWGQEVRNLKILDISKRLGIVFQDPDTQLFLPTVEDEIAFGPENLMVEREEIGRRIEKVLQLVNMENYRYENPNNLSGGQKQLIAIAAILSMEPDILLFDEILSQLDNKGKRIINDLTMRLKRENKTVILVEHDLDSINFGDRILELKSGKLIEFKGW